MNCKCGHTVVFSNEHRCEDCYSVDQERWHGRDQSVDIKGIFRDKPYYFDKDDEENRFMR